MPVMQAVLDKIAEAERTNATTLDLSSNDLTELPESITKLTSLTVLNLSNNRLTQLPE